MDSSVPDYIFASGLSAQQARNKRTISRPTSPRTPLADYADLDMPMQISQHLAASVDALEIKTVVGHLSAAHRAWPQQMQFDMPRLIQLYQNVSIESGLKAVAALDSTITFITKHRRTALGCLVRWFDYCRQNADFADGVCNAARLRVYSDHVIKQIELKGLDSLYSIFLSYCSSVSSLWVVWVHLSTNSDQERKGAFEIEYVPLRQALKQRLEQKYGTDSSSGTVRQSVSPRETPDLSSLTIGGRKNTSENASDSADHMLLQGASLSMARVALTIQQHFTNTNGVTRSFDSSPMDHTWRVFSYDSDTLIHSILLRRSSQCSLQMRLWHALSVSTWLDADSLCKGITLGSLSLRPKRLSATATANVITIQTKRIYDTSSRQGSSGGATDGKELRNSRSASEGGQFKVELLRNRRIVPCPWNALAVFLFHKWHVLNEPPPDFSNPAWVDEPLFQGGASLRDAHLLEFCDEHYREYQRAFEHGKQTYKCISQRTFTAMEMALSSSRMLKGAVSSARTLYATQRVLQNGVYDDMLVSNAGFSIDSRAQPYHIARQHCTTFTEYEYTIFPFADYLPSHSEANHNGVEMDQRQAIIGFCNMLKSLRTVLLQDAALMLYTPFYRQMLKHSSVFGLPVFLSDEFRDKAEAAGQTLVTVECMPMYGSMPRDIRLGKVVPILRIRAPRSPVCSGSSKDVSRRRQSLQRQASESAESLPDSADSVADQSTSGESNEEFSSGRVARLRELSGVLSQSLGRTGVVAEQPVSNESSLEAKARRMSRLRELNSQLGASSAQTNSIEEQQVNKESSQEARSRRVSRLRELNAQLGESPGAKRRRTEKDITPPTKLECSLVPEPRAALSQYSADASSQRRTSMLSPSSSIYLIEDDDGNFVDMAGGDNVSTETLDREQDSVDTVAAAAATSERGMSNDIQAIFPGNGDSASPMDWEGIAYESLADITLNSPTPESISEAAVPELDSAAETAHSPGPTLPLSNESKDTQSNIEAPQISSDAPAAEYAEVLARTISELCKKRKLLLKPSIKLHKALFTMRIFVKRIVTLRTDTASTLVRNGVVDSQAVERMRKLNTWLHRTKEMLAKLEDMVGSNNDMLGELVGSGVEEAVGCAVALLSQLSGDDTSLL
ncbi:hypothetical protein GGH94_001541 [Coemansia aciculifera]|uniref:Ndc10 domain-containing protein n=2 Tax=Coemansia TaxID=4863 RepID=A0A9W8IKI9_9FUNG|nr:hypothetical protein GGH94_001541 [Coemansia aciculifera]